MSIEGYEILREITRDADHANYEARQKATGRRVTLQLTHHGPYARLDWCDFRRGTLHALALLDHPNLVPILDVGDHDSGCYLVRPLLDAVAPSFCKEPRQAAQWAEQLANAVDHCHDHGIFGLRLGVDDVLIQGGEPRLNVVHVAHVNFLYPPLPPVDPPVAAMNAIMPVTSAISPEQIRGKGRPDDPRRDVWSLGVLLYRLLTGHFPFAGPGVFEVILATLEEEPIPPRQHRPEIPDDLAAVCLRCLCKKPEGRYPTVRELAQALRAHLEGRPLLRTDEPPTLASRMGKWVRGWWAGAARA